MRVLLLNDGGTPVGGAELQALRTRDLLRGAGHEVRLLSSGASELGVPSQADAVCFGTTHPKLRVLSQTANPSAALALRRELASFRPDVVHLRMYLTQLSPLVLPLLRGVPTVWQAVYYKAICPRGTKVLPDGSRCAVPAGRACLRNRCVTPQSWVLDMTQQQLRRRWAGSLDAVITLSETMRRRLEENGIPVADVIPNGVRQRPARPPLTGPPTVAFAGRLVPEKGVQVLVDAFAQVAAAVPDARLLVAGDGPGRAALDEQVDRLGLAAQVEVTGHLDRETLERRFDTAWVQAVPGVWEEPLGNVTLEAMMRGTAVVASDLGGPGEVVRHDSTGLLVRPGSVDSLAAALRSLLIDRPRCEELGRRGREIALTSYAEHVTVQRLERLYRSLLPPAADDVRSSA
ncbi:glycosyltransferase family 4 protein [Modestobacter sp. VKM Ac-2985]|uniref:glycosyltransferase family 4 protein n=1 Tax=Modestobacter sp. VKM Ac-2985 TaxID=3004139 RepID=UPI0022AB5CD2|nr:glycosyltransferase family 4 protein [Modestobacter sp. VKM Ac-2985]MCZ2837703.1 glycosyltransferase family 4 protein [Modestobacter sp. VKM Ac-2985]